MTATAVDSRRESASASPSPSLGLPDFRAKALSADPQAGLTRYLGLEGSDHKVTVYRNEEGLAQGKISNGNQSLAFKATSGPNGEMTGFNIGGVQLAPQVARQFTRKMMDSLQTADETGHQSLHYVSKGQEISMVSQRVKSDGEKFSHDLKVVASTTPNAEGSSTSADIYGLEGNKGVTVAGNKYWLHPRGGQMKPFVPDPSMKIAKVGVLQES